MSKAQELAQAITENLFRNGDGETAQRLVLELVGKRDGGGWCKEAVQSQIQKALEEAGV